MRVLDTFAGIGGFSCAHGPQDVTVGFVEKDLACQMVLRNAFPGVPIAGDIRTFRGDEFGEFDLLTGGFPCQPFSRNGKFYNKNNRTLGDDDRANLFLELVRILRDFQPTAFLFENVKEILTIKNADGSSFLSTLLDNLAGVGYRVTHSVFSPTQWGVPQQRNRVFFVGIRNDIGPGFTFADPPAPVHSRVLEYLDDSVDPKYLLVNQWRNRKMSKSAGTRLEALQASYGSGTRTATLDGYTDKISPVAIIYGDTPSGLPRQQDKLYSVYGHCPTIATFSTPAFDVPIGWRTLTPKECLRLQSFPDGHPIATKDAAGYKQVGNSVNVTVAGAIVDQIRAHLACY